MASSTEDSKNVNVWMKKSWAKQAPIWISRASHHNTANIVGSVDMDMPRSVIAKKDNK